MTQKLAEITILSDDEGMFGGIDDEEMSKIDVSASIESYQKECRNRLESVYPECEFVFKHEPYSSKSIRILDLTDDNMFDPHGWESDNIQEICGAVFEFGNFWVTK